MSKNRIIQLTPTFSAGDAVSNDVIAMSEVLSLMGFENYIVALNISKKMEGRAVRLNKYIPRENDIFVYHMSIGNEMSEFVIRAKVKRKIMVYHNITPYEYFEGISPLADPCRQGRLELVKLKDCIDFALCDSDYNKEELDSMGYKNTATLPIVFDKVEYLETSPSESVLKKYGNDGYTNILFVGRIVPNKKQEDVIQSFHLYRKYINSKARLFLVGAVVTTERYMEALNEYIADNKIEGVHFRGHVSFPEILAYYKLSDIFLCESEHEGFCVPLLEAMTFNIPVIAYKSSAIPYTMGDSGIIVNEKDHALIAETINAIVTNDNLRAGIIKKQQKRLADFEIDKTKQLFRKLITPWLIIGD